MGTAPGSRPSRRRPPARPATGLWETRPGPFVAVELAPHALVQVAWRAAPALRAVPLAIARPGGPLLAACPRAIGMGVLAGQTVTQARLRCPALVVRPPDDAGAALLYEALLRALLEISPLVEDTDPDAGAALLDARGLAALYGEDEASWDGRAVAGAARRLLAGSGLAVRTGAGPTRLVARALTRQMGRDGPRAVSAGEVGAYLEALPLTEPALGLAPRTLRALADLGLATAGALTALPEAAVAVRFGPTLVAARRALAPRDDAPPRRWTPPDEISVARHLGAVEDAAILDAALDALCARLHDLLAARGRSLAALTLLLSCDDGAEHARQAYPWPPLQGTGALAAAARELRACCPITAPVEAIELRAARLCAPDAVQYGWADDEPERRRARLVAVLDARARAWGSQGSHPLQRWRRDPLAPEGWTRGDAGDASGGGHAGGRAGGPP